MILLTCFFEQILHVENTASRKVSGGSRKGFRKENRKVFYSGQNTASWKVSGRGSGSKPGRFCGFFHICPYQARPKRLELVPDKIRKVTGRYPEATFAKKCKLRARAHLVTVDARPRRTTKNEKNTKDKQIIHNKKQN